MSRDWTLASRKSKPQRRSARPDPEPMKSMRATRREVLALAATAALRAWPASAGTASEPYEAPAGTGPADLDQVWELVRDRFYDPRLNGLDWGQERARFRPRAASAGSQEEAAAAINAMLAKLGASHTHFYTRDDPAYYQLADIFAGALEHRGLKRVFPTGDVSYRGIGVFARADGPGPDLHNRSDRGRDSARSRPSRRRRSPFGGRPPVPPGRLLPRQGRRPRLASNPPRGRRGADHGRRRTGRPSSERDVPARPETQRADDRRRQGPDRLRARLVLCEPQVPVRARGPDRRGPAQGGRRARLGPARRMGRR